MVQARRKKQAKTKRAPRKRGSGFGLTSQCISFLFAGVLIGVLSTLFWQGYRTTHQDDIGSGLKDMVDKSRQSAQRAERNKVPAQPITVDNTPRQTADYDFYTVLPAIEEVLPKTASEPKVAAVKVKPKANKDSSQIVPATQAPGTTYFLQVASYRSQPDADRLKARLALNGLRAAIQNVSIENQQYYRVRIGPYSDYGNMTADDLRLSKLGFKALRLRVSGG